MSEQPFDEAMVHGQRVRVVAVTPPCERGAMNEQAPDKAFDYGELLDEFRTHTVEWLRARWAELVREQRRLHAEELAGGA